MKKLRNVLIEVRGTRKSEFDPDFNDGKFATIRSQAGRLIAASRASERRFCPSITVIYDRGDATNGQWLKMGSNSLEFEGITPPMKIGAAL